jgi:hypothetical protein
VLFRSVSDDYFQRTFCIWGITLFIVCVYVSISVGVGVGFGVVSCHLLMVVPVCARWQFRCTREHNSIGGCFAAVGNALVAVSLW